MEALKTLKSFNMVLDLNPPASGPEAEVSIEGIPERRLTALLTMYGVSVLASRTRMGAEMTLADFQQQG
jgi:hypothetical protein